MHFKYIKRAFITALVAAGSALAIHGHENTHLEKMKRQLNPKLSEQLASLTSMYSVTSGAVSLPTGTMHTPFPGLEQPPQSVMVAIITGVPATVLPDLIDKKSRASLASEFAAGHTPAWYEDLPEAAKSYITAIRSQTADGAITATTTFQSTETPLMGEKPGEGADGSPGLGASPPEATAAAVAAMGLAGFMGALMVL